ncbi:MAG: hypothetical protein WC630_05820, partial [Candidatus Babeliales bacterium]
MKFLRFLSLILITIMVSSPLRAEVTLSIDDLKSIGLAEGAQLRIGSGNTWGYLQHNAAGDYHIFNVINTPTTILGTIGASNLASIFNVTAVGDKVALWVTVFDSGYTAGKSEGTRYADNPTCTTTPTSFSVVSLTNLPSNKPGVYKLGFKRADGAYLMTGHVDATTTPQYYDVEILTAARKSNRGDPLFYENTCYRISIAGTPLFGWFYTDNYTDQSVSPSGKKRKRPKMFTPGNYAKLPGILTGAKKKFLFGTLTYATGPQDTRQDSLASYMVILNSDQNKCSAGPIKYGDFVRIVGLHTANSNTDTAVNNFVEAYTWFPAEISGATCTIGGRVYNFQTNTPVPDNNELLVIVNQNYAKGTPVCANDSIRLIPYFAEITGAYPYTSTSGANFFFAPNSDTAYASPFVNAKAPNSTRYNLFSLTAVAKDTTAPYLSAVQISWNLSTEYQYFIVPVTKATTITDILTKVHAALTKPNIADKDAIGASCMTKLETAIGLATTAQHCTDIGDDLKLLTSLGFATISLQTKLNAQLAQINQKQAVQKEAQQDLATAEANRIAALNTKDITAMISALNGIIAATPVIKANVRKAIATAFTTATPLVKSAADAAALATSFANAFKKGYVASGAQSAFDTRYKQIKTETSAVTALTQKTTTLVDLNKALASVVSYKAPITDGFTTQVLAGIEKAFGAAKAQWAQVQTLRKSKVARDVN